MPLGLEKIVEKCLAKHSDDRYASARDLLEALRVLYRKITYSQHAAESGSLVQDSVAVLPFVNMSTDPKSEFFADGITEEKLMLWRKFSHCGSQLEALHLHSRGSISICASSGNGSMCGLF